MSDQPTVDAAHPPEGVLRVINPTLRFVLKTPLGGAIGDFMLVTFTGRKSGKRYSTPVSAHRLDGDLYVVLEAQWKHNFRGGADAQVAYRGKTRTMHGELITDRSAVAAICERVATSYGPKKAQRQMGMTFREGRLPSVAEWEEAVDQLKIAAIKLTSKV
ncbi:deazaflavin-dependent oxidoreductase (nitroreductase family) [Mycolicibacterium iranicum]|uniref:Deazaflavin-dependent oxidoreductase (Nitroreductase family) n=1 Tax=Mycolicibacterium iranicum TaxID=912594 RepID=A0A839Q5T6_MYCIR|nr:nitroreductase/quinone reductase family protein [Mycolicibacterium iranicum]MBB2989596.1 deazaflavin-dependent oxidoreductase (nitroreductase family) [Mycolicibacterium iranicum]